MNHTEPCIADPVSYDLDETHGTPHPTVAQLVHACQTRCPIYEWCQAQPHEGLYGVVGGQYRPWPIPIPNVDALADQPATLKAAEWLAAVIPTLAPGDRVPSQRDVCKATGVGRPVARKAMDVFAAAGILASPGIPGPAGRYVVLPSPDHTPATAAA